MAALTVQNLRAVDAGVKPASLLPGQLCFNVADKIIFVGDGSSFFTSYDGTQLPAPAGAGWFSAPLSGSGGGSYYVVNPEVFGDFPTDGQVLTWDQASGLIVWEDTNQTTAVYITTNLVVSNAPGTDISAKISNAIGTTPSEADEVIVQGVPGDFYQGYYVFTSGNWQFAANYAFPTANQVPYSTVPGGPSGANVAEALLNTYTVADNALPKSGGTMTGDINFVNGQPVDAGSF